MAIHTIPIAMKQYNPFKNVKKTILIGSKRNNKYFLKLNKIKQNNKKKSTFSVPLQASREIRVNK
jgi:hypothetical protein